MAMSPIVVCMTASSGSFFVPSDPLKQIRQNHLTAISIWLHQIDLPVPCYITFPEFLHGQKATNPSNVRKLYGNAFYAGCLRERLSFPLGETALYHMYFLWDIDLSLALS